MTADTKPPTIEQMIEWLESKLDQLDEHQCRQMIWPHDTQTIAAIRAELIQAQAMREALEEAYNILIHIECCDGGDYDLPSTTADKIEIALNNINAALARKEPRQ